MVILITEQLKVDFCMSVLINVFLASGGVVWLWCRQTFP